MKKKVLFADLDGTIIETLTGAPFPKGNGSSHEKSLRLNLINKNG